MALPVGNPGAFAKSSTLGPRIMFNVDDGGGNGADPAPAPVPAPAPAPAPSPPPAPAPVVAARPDGLDEKFWDEGTKSVKFGDIKSHIDELTAFKAEQDSRRALMPESADKYELKLPADFKVPEGFVPPDGQDISINADDPRVAMARDYVHGLGGTQEDFEKIVAMGVQADIAEQMEFETRKSQEIEKLGSRGSERFSAATQWLDAKGLSALGRVMIAADQIEAVERLMSMNRQDTRGNGSAKRDGQSSNGIEGYETMNFRQRMAAIDAMKARQ